MSLFDPGYYTEKVLRLERFKYVGTNVSIAKNCTIIGVENIEIADNVRIDGYCTIIAKKGFIKIGEHTHIGCNCFLSGGAGIIFEGFNGTSQGTRIYSTSDDYTGKFLHGPMVPEEYTGVKKGVVTLGRHVLIGSSSVILPGVTIGEGSSAGAKSLITKNLAPWGVYFGIPVKRLKDRHKDILELEKKMKGELCSC